jgi:hypothetical protein
VQGKDFKLGIQEPLKGFMNAAIRSVLFCYRE